MSSEDGLDPTVHQNADAFVSRISSVPFLQQGSQISQPIFHTDASKRAWDLHLQSLSKEQRDEFLKYNATTIDQYIKYVEEASTNHKTASRIVQINKFLQPFVRTLGPAFGVAATAASQAYPPSSVITGGVMYLLKISEDFSAYQERLSKWLAKLSFKAELLLKYDLCIYQYDDRVQDVLVLVYGDILQFFKSALLLFEKYHKSSRTGFKTLWASMKGDFDDVFGPIIDNFERHLEEYERATKICDGQWLIQSYSHHVNEALKNERMRLEHRMFQQEQRQHNRAMISSLSDHRGITQMNRDQDAAELARIRAEEERIRKESKRIDILRWIPLVDLVDEHDRRTDLKTDGTAVWLQGTSDFQDWISAISTAFLLIKGKPGCGKSILAAETWNFIEAMKSPEVAVAHFYCESNQIERSNPTKLLASILRELCHQLDAVYPELEALYDSKAQVQPKGPSASEVSRHLPLAASRFKQILILIDGLDECQDPGKVLNDLRKMARDAKSAVKLIVFSRPEYLAIESSFKGWPHISVDDGANTEDLKSFVNQKMSDNESEWKVNPGLLDIVKNTLVGKCEGVFLYAKLQAQGLTPSLTKAQVYQKLETLPKGLNETYQRALTRITKYEDKEKQDLAFRILIWIVNSIRPLSRRELLHALSIDHNVKTLAEVDPIMSDREFVTLCADLVQVDKDGFYIPIHASVREYLKDLVTDCPAEFSMYKTKQMEADKTIAEICLIFLLVKEFQGGPVPSLSALENLKKDHPFLEYAASHWGNHVRKISRDCPNGLIWEFVNNKPARDLTMQIALKDDDDFKAFPFPGTETPLHILAWFGLCNIADQFPSPEASKNLDGFKCLPIDYALLKNQHSMCLWFLQKYNASDVSHMLDHSMYSAIHVAVENEWDDVVDELISKGCDVNEVPRYLGRTPLAQSAALGYLHGVQKLLENGAKTSVLDYNSRSPLVLALEGNYTDVALTLMRSGSDVNSSDKDGETPLYLAASNGNAVVMTKLLLSGAQLTPTVERTGSNTPLHISAEKNHVECIKILHQNGANLDVEDAFGGTPLHDAIKNNSLESVKLLRELGANMLAVKKNGWTALMCAASFGNETMLRCVLESDFCLETKDIWGGTALHATAGSGNISACKIILGKGAALESVNSANETALHYALDNGQLETAIMLLSKGADPNWASDDGKSAIHYTAANGMTELLPLLLEKNVDLAARTNENESALHIAASCGHNDFILEFLKVCPTLDIQALDDDGSTPLHLAADGGHLETVRLLLQKGAYGIKDHSSNFPIHLAAWEGHEKIVYLLLNEGTLNVQGHYGRTPIYIAALRGHESLVKSLLEKGARTDISDDDDDEPLMIIVQNNENISELLISHGANLQAVNCENYGMIHAAAATGQARLLQKIITNGGDGTLRSKSGITPFIAAAYSGSIEALDVLLDAGIDGIKDEDDNGRTAFHHAVFSGQMDMLEKLLSLHSDPTAVDKWGLSSLHHAVAAGRSDIVSKLLNLGLPVDDPRPESLTPPLIVASEFGFTEIVDILLQRKPDINMTDNLYGRTALIAAAEDRRSQTVGKLLAAGADPFLRDCFGMSALDYASRHEITYEAMGQHRFFHAPVKSCVRINILQDTIRETLKGIPDITSESTARTILSRGLKLGVLASSLASACEDLQHETAKLVVLEIWQGLYSNFGLDFKCGMCEKPLTKTDAFICMECHGEGLCSICHSNYSKGWREEKTCPKSHRTLEKLEMELDLALKELLPVFQHGNIEDLLYLLDRFKIIEDWLRNKSKEYKDWDLEHNKGNFYKHLDRPGKDFLDLIERTQKMKEMLRTRGSLTDMNEDNIGADNLIKDFRKFYKTNCPMEEKNFFNCAGHEYIKIGQADLDVAMATGGIFDPDGRLSSAWLESLRERYKEDELSTQDEPRVMEEDVGDVELKNSSQSMNASNSQQDPSSVSFQTRTEVQVDSSSKILPGRKDVTKTEHQTIKNSEALIEQSTTFETLGRSSGTVNDEGGNASQGSKSIISAEIEAKTDRGIFVLGALNISEHAAPGYSRGFLKRRLKVDDFEEFGLGLVDQGDGTRNRLLSLLESV